MPDEPVTPVCPMLARHELHQIALDFFRVFLVSQAKPLRQPDDMRVHDDAIVFPKRVAQHNIRRLAAYAGQRA